MVNSVYHDTVASPHGAEVANACENVLTYFSLPSVGWILL